MKRFREFVSEMHTGHVPVVSLEKNHVDLGLPETVSEINKNLAMQLTREFESPEVALHKIKKILSGYSIEIPETQISDESGELTLPVSQYSISGERHSGEVYSPTKPSSKTQSSLSIKYNKGEAGHKVSAKIV